MPVRNRLPLTHFLFTAAMLAPLAAAPALAQDAAPQPPVAVPAPAAKPVDPAAVAPLLAKLSDTDAASRRAAVDGLVALGAGARPEIEKFLTGPADKKAKARAQVALDRIDATTTGDTTTATATNVGPTLVTLDMADADAAEVFDALFAQAKAKYVTQPPGVLQNTDDFPPVTLKVDKANFWTVFRDLCKETGLNPQQHGEPGVMTLSKNADADWATAPSVVSGAFLITARSVQSSRSVNLARPDQPQDNLSIQFYAYPEPGLRVMRSSYSIILDEAVDDDGNSLLPEREQGGGYSNGRQSVWQFQAPLNPKAATGDKISRLKGTAKFGVQAESGVVEFTDLTTAKNVVKNAGKMRVTLKEMKKNERGGGDTTTYEVRLSVARGSDDNNVVYGSIGTGMKMVDANGREFASQGYGGGGTEYTATFVRRARNGDGPIPGEPVKLIWEIPTKVIDLNVPFEFKDLPLP